jgi:hypothetical protein
MGIALPFAPLGGMLSKKVTPLWKKVNAKQKKQQLSYPVAMSAHALL